MRSFTMSDRTLCRLCEKKPPRRFCPAITAEICAPCCGVEREQSLDCPFDCEHLREARKHEKLPEFDARNIPNADIELTDSFLERNQDLAIITGRILLMGALDTQGIVDSDMRDALDALVRTYKTADSGLVYQSRPTNTYADAVQQRFQAEVQRFREMVAQQTGSHAIKEKDLLGILVFWQRMELQRSNGRRKGRAFIESLFSLLPPPREDGESPDAASVIE
jgi:hypothetical protein